MLEELKIKISAVSDLGGFDQLKAKLKSSESISKSSSTNIRNNLNQINSTRFDGLGNKFKSVIHGMASTAKAGAKSIADTLTSMTSSVEGALAGLVGAYSVGELFEKAMSKSLTTTQLKNVKGKAANSIMDQYMLFTERSSASDEDINKMLRFTYTGPGGMTYRSLNALDAASYSADKLQRMEGIRGWGTYLSGGWQAASGMMRDEPLTAKQKQLLQSANTYEERVAAMEQIAFEKGNLDRSDKALNKFGDSLSTTVDGPLGKYNKALAAQDAIMRGATSTFETFMATIEPAITWFTNLDQGTKNVVGGLLTFGAIILTFATGLGLLLQLLSPFKSVFGKVKDWVWGDKTAAKMDVKAGVVNVNGKSTGSTPGSGTTSAGSAGALATMTYVTGGVVSLLGLGYLANRLEDWGLYKDTGSGLLGGLAGGPLGVVGSTNFWKGQAGVMESAASGKGIKASLQSGLSRFFPDKDQFLAALKLGSIVSSFKWPTPGEIGNYIESKIPGLQWPASGSISGVIRSLIPVKIPKLNWPAMGGLYSFIQSRISTILNQWKYKLLGITAVSGLGVGAGAPGLTDDLYGVGSYFEPVISIPSTSEGTSIVNKNVLHIGSVDSTERVNEIVTALSDLNDSKGR